MKYIFPVPLALVVVFCLAGCKKDRIDTYLMSTPDLSKTGENGANLAVDEGMRLDVTQRVISQVYGEMKNIADQYHNYLNADSNAVFDFQFRSLGGNHGYVDARGNVTKVYGPDSVSYDIDYDIYTLLVNYSDSASVFLGGSLHLTGEIFQARTLRTVFMVGYVDFTGDYAGHIDFHNLNLPLDPGGRLLSVWSTQEDLGTFRCNGALEMASGSETFLFNPYYRPLASDTTGTSLM